jgi:hypothetical protein
LLIVFRSSPDCPIQRKCTAHAASEPIGRPAAHALSRGRATFRIADLIAIQASFMQRIGLGIRGIRKLIFVQKNDP